MMAGLVRTTRFTTFDGTISLSTRHQRPDRYSHLEAMEPTVHRIPRGGGYSYSAASFGEYSLVQDMTCFNRFLEFDPEHLTLRLEAGVRLIDLMQWALQRNLYFPVLPGYPLITIGGSVAADVHGKNPFGDGTFSNWVRELTLYHPQRGFQTCSREVNPALFNLTCGGFGLTGVITEITLQLETLPAPAIRFSRKSLENLGAAQQELSIMEADIAYSWHDGAPGPHFGRGILYTGTWAESRDRLEPFTFSALTAHSRGKLPFSTWNALTARAANAAMWRYSRHDRQASITSVLQASFPFASNICFHRLFGRRGLREVQFLVPEQSTGQCLESLSALICDSRAPTIMISIKRFRGCQQSLSMSGTGYLVAVVCYRNDKTDTFLRRLDALMLDAGGQPNLSKDSRLPRDVAESSISGFSQYKHRLFKYDPERIMRSELSARLGLL